MTGLSEIGRSVRLQADRDHGGASGLLFGLTRARPAPGVFSAKRPDPLGQPRGKSERYWAEPGHDGCHGPAEAGHYIWYALKQDLSRTRTTTREVAPDDEEMFSRIRCPLCAWRPSPADLWSCVWTEGSPEPLFPSCGAIWNTFKTRGSCPGCHHRWRWTSCLACAGWSPHEDWYEVSPA